MDVIQIAALAYRYFRNGRLSRAGLRTLQSAKLRRLLSHAKRRCPYYSDVLAHIDPARCALTELPTTR